MSQGWPLCMDPYIVYFLTIGGTISSYFTGARLKTRSPYLLTLVKTNGVALKSSASTVLQSSLTSPRYTSLLGFPISWKSPPLFPFWVVAHPSPLPKPLEGALPWGTPSPFWLCQNSAQIKLITRYCHLVVISFPWAAPQILELTTSGRGWDSGDDQGIGHGVYLTSQQDSQLANGSWTALNGWVSTLERSSVRVEQHCSVWNYTVFSRLPCNTSARPRGSASTGVNPPLGADFWGERCWAVQRRKSACLPGSH